MRYGYCFWYEDGDISSIPSQVKELKLDFAEIALTYPWPDMVPRIEIQRTKKKLADLDVRFAFHAPLEGLFLFNPRNEIANAAIKIHKKCLKFSAKLEPFYYNFHIKADPTTLHIKSKDIALRRCLNGLDEITKLARELNVKLIVENSSSTGYLVPVQELLERGIDLNLDVGH